MCTYATVRESVDGSAKGPNGTWFTVTDVTVYFDHPAHTMAEHTLNIDVANPTIGTSTRVAVELTAESARRLIRALAQALSSVPADLIHVPGSLPDPRSLSRAPTEGAAPLGTNGRAIAKGQGHPLARPDPRPSSDAVTNKLDATGLIDGGRARLISSSTAGGSATGAAPTRR